MQFNAVSRQIVINLLILIFCETNHKILNKFILKVIK